MIRPILIALLLTSISQMAIADCSNDALGASYKITTSDLNGKHKKVSHLTLWRNGEQVAHEHKETAVTEVWERLNNGQLRLVRDFDRFKQGIEYEPNEIKIKHNDVDWQVKKQLISQLFIDDMTLVSTTGNDCNTQRNYIKKSNKDKINLQWLVNQKLIYKLIIESAKETVSWELLTVENNTNKVKNLFKRHADYKMTDYADIGDNESDPFLMKMINMGFVSHSSPGMYNQNGKAFDAEHKH